VIAAILASPLTPLEDLLRHVLDWLHGSIGLSWAWSIVALTVIVRLLLVPLTVRQIHSMQNLQRHAPQMKELQKKYKTDKKRQQEELMKFYKENNINPAASCLPLLAQFPVFISLYLVLRHFAKHVPCPGHPEQQGHFCIARGDFSWLHNFVPNIASHASSHWSGFVLLAIYVVSQLVSTLLMATTMDKTQRTMLLVLPVGFVVFLVNFPTGLVLYWVTTNLWTVGQGLITRRMMPKPEVAPRRSSRTPPREQAEAEPEEDGSGEPAAVPAPPAAPSDPKRVRRKKKKGGARR
jgi:YidC/Oxa1 family membrane protein insertase